MLPWLIFFAWSGAARGELVAGKNPLELGVIVQDLDSVSAVFTLTNISASETITIQNVTTACGCSAATVASKSVSPKESTTLTVTLDLAKVKAGPFRKNAYVIYQEQGAAKQLEVVFTGSASPQEFYVGREVDFATVRGDHIEPKTVSLAPYLKGTRLQEIVASDPLLVVQANRDPNSDAVAAKIGFQSEKLPFGRYETYMLLRTDDPNYPRVKVPVTVTRLKPQLLDPERLYASAEGGDNPPFGRIAFLLESSDTLEEPKVSGLPSAWTYTIERDASSRPTGIAFAPGDKFDRNAVGVMAVNCVLNGETRTERVPYYFRAVNPAESE